MQIYYMIIILGFVDSFAGIVHVNVVLYLAEMMRCNNNSFFTLKYNFHN